MLVRVWFFYPGHNLVLKHLNHTTVEIHFDGIFFLSIFIFNDLNWGKTLKVTCDLENRKWYLAMLYDLAWRKSHLRREIMLSEVYEQWLGGYYIFPRSKMKSKVLTQLNQYLKAVNTVFTTWKRIVCKLIVLVHMTENPTTRSDQTKLIITCGVVCFICWICSQSLHILVMVQLLVLSFLLNMATVWALAVLMQKLIDLQKNCVLPTSEETFPALAV